MTTKVVFDISLTIILLTAKTVFGLNSILNFDQKKNPYNSSANIKKPS